MDRDKDYINVNSTTNNKQKGQMLLEFINKDSMKIKASRKPFFCIKEKATTKTGALAHT